MKPFFIVGSPRTGTTLLRRILTAHPEVAIPPESTFITEYLRATHVPLETRKTLFLADPGLEEWQVSFRSSDFASAETMAGVIRLAHERYAAQVGRSHWGQKAARLVRHWQLLRETFPDAVFVHPRRDPRAVVASLKRSKAHQLNALMGARRWRDDTARGLAMVETLGERALTYAYEDLVSDPEPVVRRLCDHLGLRFDPSMLETPATQISLTASEQRAGHHVNVTRPINTSSVERWRKDLDEHEQAIVAEVAGEVARRAGYTLPDASPLSRRQVLELQLQNLGVSVRKSIQSVREKPEIWRLAKRHLRLGSMGRVFSEAFGGRAPN
ncbi:MAG: sulfotransferase [Myxococcota bacterium]